MDKLKYPIIILWAAWMIFIIGSHLNDFIVMCIATFIGLITAIVMLLLTIFYTGD